MKRKPIVAIDGPGGAGKSTIARLVAQRLGLRYLDSGAMYRALAWQARRLGLTAAEPEAVADCCRRLKLRLEPGPDGGNRVYIGETEITQEIRDPACGGLASELSELPAVRRCLVDLQRKLGEGGGIVMEGRDIQTVVFPQADLKVFLTASLPERARRRWLELRERGRELPLEKVEREIRERDARDQGREDSPLRPAPDAVHLDTSGLSLDDVVSRILFAAKEKLGIPAGS